MKKIGRCLLALLIAGFSHAVVAQTMVSKRDKKFAECVAQNGMMEVKLSQLAQNKSVTPEVKSAAQQMIDAHGKANEELKELSARKGISLPSSINEKQQKYYDKMAKMDGKDFDKKYAMCMVHDHKKSLCLFKKQAKKGENPELKSWASGKVPILESHLNMWKETCKATKK